MNEVHERFKRSTIRGSIQVSTSTIRTVVVYVQHTDTPARYYLQYSTSESLVIIINGIYCTVLDFASEEQLSDWVPLL